MNKFMAKLFWISEEKILSAYWRKVTFIIRFTVQSKKLASICILNPN